MYYCLPANAALCFPTVTFSSDTDDNEIGYLLLDVEMCVCVY